MTQDLTGTYEVIAERSNLEFSVRHMVVSHVKGQFIDFEGTVKIDSDLLKSTGKGKIRASSISTGDDIRDKHVRSQDVLHVASYPFIEFKSLSIRDSHSGLVVTGNLTIKGNTNPIELDIRNYKLLDNDCLRISATSKLSRKQFKVTWNALIEASSAVVSDNVDLTLDIILHKSK